MSLVDVAPWHVQRRLTAAGVDAWLSEAGSNPGHVVFELGRWQKNQQFAEAALLGALSLWTRSGARIEAILPPLTFEGDRAERVFGDARGRGTGHVTPSEKLLADTTAGLLLGHFADLGENHAEIRDRQLRRLQDSDGVYGNGHERAQVTLIDGREPPRRSRSPLATRLARLERVLTNLLESVAPARGTSRLEQLKPVVDFCFQAWDNARDHGELDTDGNVLKSARLLSVRRTTIGLAGTTTEANPVGSSLQDYVSQLTQRLQSSGIADPSACRLLEVTVADGGIGVPARMHGTTAIYDLPLSDEHAVLVSALRPKGTTKSASDHVGRGGGFPIMLDAAHRFHGLALYRSGRTSVSRHFIDGTHAGELNVWDDKSEAYDVRLNSDPLPLTGGTSATFICPLDMSVQRQL